jgi:SAM-dependent methyltransferase
MNPEEYPLMRGQEDVHWWYLALRAAVLRHLETRLPVAPARILDAGCGTGGMLRQLRARFPEAGLIGVDRDEQAVQLSAARGAANQVVRGSLNALPFRDRCFDAVVSLDVLVHAAIDEAAALGELGRVLRPGGVLILNLAAFDTLRGAHDAAVHGVRRYSPRRLRELAAAHGLAIERWTCWNTTLLPLLWAWRSFGRVSGSQASDLRLAPNWVNKALAGVMRAEWMIADRVPLPLGSSLFAVLRRPHAT